MPRLHRFALVLAVTAAALCGFAAGQQATPAGGAASGRDLRLLLKAPRGSKITDVRVFRWTGTAYRQVPVRPAIAGASTVVLAGGCKEHAVYLVESSTLVSHPIRLGSGGCSAPIVPVHLFQRAVVQLQAVAAGSSRLPKAAVLRVSSCPPPTGQGSSPERRLPVAVSKSGRVTASVPAGCADLSLLTPNFAPVSWWGIQLLPGKVNALGTVHLRSGASLLVRTVDADDGLGLKGVVVRLVRAADGAGAIQKALRRARFSAVTSGVSGTRGWLRLSGLDGGQYVLIATAKRHTPDCENVRLKRGSETVVDPVPLSHPGAMDVYVDTGNLELPPDLALTLSTRVRLCCHDVSGAPPTKVPASGFVRLQHLVPGRWHLVVSAGRANGLEYTLGKATATVASGESTSVEVPLTGTLFRGEVLREDEPVEAELHFDPVKGHPGDSAAFSKSRADGSFLVILPRPGAYDVRVSTGKPGSGTTSTVPGVSFTDPTKVVKIHLPEGEIDGSVVDENGDAVPGADVTAYRLVEPGASKSPQLPPVARAVADDDGTFSLVGLVTGRWAVSAQQGDLESSPTSIEITHGGGPASITLVVRQTVHQQGDVRFGDGRPVAHAWVHAYTLTSAGLPRMAQAITGGTGHFELRVQAQDGAEANLVVARSGIAAQPFRVKLSPKRPLELTVSSTGGRITLVTPKKAQGLAIALVRADGAFLTFADVPSAQLEWRQGGHGLEMTLANLAPGSWSVVPAGPSTASVLISGAGAALPTLGRFTLGPGSIQQVTISR